MLSRVSGSISEPDTPPSDLEDSKKDPRSVRRVGSVDGRQTPPPQVHSAGHPKPRVAPQQPESENRSEDVAVTLMALMVTSTAAQEAPSSVTQDAPGSPAASSSSVKKPTRKRKRDGKPAPTQQPKHEMSVADDRAVFQPSASQLMQLVSSGVVPHFAIFAHGPSGHSTAAFGQPQASGPVWQTAPQSHQPMLAFGGHAPQMQSSTSMPLSSGATTMVPTDWIRSGFQCVDMPLRNLGAGPIIPDTLSQLHAPVGFGAYHADYRVPQGREDRPVDGPEAAPTICPLCQAGGDKTPGLPKDVNTDSAEDSGSEQQAQKQPRQRRKRTMSRKRSCLRLGKWWKKYGYSGPAYCQRCSELFRDHIIRSLSNSAQCSMATPCLDCKRVLVHFLDGVKTKKKS